MAPSARADWIVYEAPGDDLAAIENCKSNYRRHKLVFILSGDQTAFQDDVSVWFTVSAPEKLHRRQWQIPGTNPRLFAWPEYRRGTYRTGVNFTGTVWPGPRTELARAALGIQGVRVRHYPWWKTRQEARGRAERAYYHELQTTSVALCPRGQGSSSMRIVEALKCGAVPALLGDNSRPFGRTWAQHLVAFTYPETQPGQTLRGIQERMQDRWALEQYRDQGRLFFRTDIAKDFYRWPDLPWSVAAGFSDFIVDRLTELKQPES